VLQSHACPEHCCEWLAGETSLQQSSVDENTASIRASGRAWDFMIKSDIIILYTPSYCDAPIHCYLSFGDAVHTCRCKGVHIPLHILYPICLKKQTLQSVNYLEKNDGLSTGGARFIMSLSCTNSECSRHSPCNESIVDDDTCSHCCGHIRHLHACWTLLGKCAKYSQFRSSSADHLPQ
jgi:hypothetical protein